MGQTLPLRDPRVHRGLPEGSGLPLLRGGSEMLLPGNRTMYYGHPPLDSGIFLYHGVLNKVATSLKTESEL